MTSLAMVALPPLEESVKVADLPAFCMRWYTSNREASSSPIFCSDSEQMIGIGFEKFWYRKKYRYRFRSFFGIDKSIDIGFEFFGIKKSIGIGF